MVNVLLKANVWNSDRNRVGDVSKSFVMERPMVGEEITADGINWQVFGIHITPNVDGLTAMVKPISGEVEVSNSSRLLGAGWEMSYVGIE